MKFALVGSMVMAVGALAMPASESWVRTLDARPEAVLIGASLLVLASGLRHYSPHKDHD